MLVSFTIYQTYNLTIEQLQWPRCEDRKGYQGKEHDIIRLGRKGKDGEARMEMAARKE